MGYDERLKWDQFCEFCMSSFRARWQNVNIVTYGKPNGEMQPSENKVSWHTPVLSIIWDTWEKTSILPVRKQRADQVTAKLISVFVFAIGIVQFFCFLNPIFPTSSCVLWLYSPVCAESGRKPPNTGFLVTRFWNTVYSIYVPCWCNIVQRLKDCLIEVIISSLQRITSWLL